MCEAWLPTKRGMLLCICQARCLIRNPLHSCQGSSLFTRALLGCQRAAPTCLRRPNASGRPGTCGTSHNPPPAPSYACRQQPQHSPAGQTGGRASGLQAGGQPLILGKGRGSLALLPLAARPRAAEATSRPWCTTRTWLTCGATASVRLVLQRTIAVELDFGAAWPTAVASQGTPASAHPWHAPPAWSQSPPAPPARAVRGWIEPNTSKLLIPTPGLSEGRTAARKADGSSWHLPEDDHPNNQEGQGRLGWDVSKLGGQVHCKPAAKRGRGEQLAPHTASLLQGCSA